MAQYYSDIYPRYLRLAAILCLTAATIGLSDTAFGLTRAELYQTVVPLADRSEASQSAAFSAALRVVLVRVTGRRTADEDPVLHRCSAIPDATFSSTGARRTASYGCPSTAPPSSVG